MLHNLAVLIHCSAWMPQARALFKLENEFGEIVFARSFPLMDLHMRSLLIFISFLKSHQTDSTIGESELFPSSEPARRLRLKLRDLGACQIGVRL